MPTLLVVAAGGDADRTDVPCSPSPARSPVLRRSPNAARSLLRKPCLRSSRTCGASSGRRVMAPASLHNNHEAARGRWSAGWPCPTPQRAGCEAVLPFGRAVVLPPLRPQHAESRTSAGRRPGTAPARFLDPAATYNTILTAPRRRWFSYRCCCAAGRAVFVPAHPIAGGSGGRSQRSLP